MPLRHMLDHAREALEYAKGKSKQDLPADHLRYLGLVHLVEIVGEAATRMTAVEQAKYPDIPWRSIIGTRNRLIHGYDQVDDEALWAILSKDLPALVASLERHLAEK